MNPGSDVNIAERLINVIFAIMLERDMITWGNNIYFAFNEIQFELNINLYFEINDNKEKHLKFIIFF